MTFRRSFSRLAASASTRVERVPSGPGAARPARRAWLARRARAPRRGCGAVAQCRPPPRWRRSSRARSCGRGCDSAWTSRAPASAATSTARASPMSARATSTLSCAVVTPCGRRAASYRRVIRRLSCRTRIATQSRRIARAIRRTSSGEAMCCRYNCRSPPSSASRGEPDRGLGDRKDLGLRRRVSGGRPVRARPAAASSRTWIAHPTTLNTNFTTSQSATSPARSRGRGHVPSSVGRRVAPAVSASSRFGFPPSRARARAGSGARRAMAGSTPATNTCLTHRPITSATRGQRSGSMFGPTESLPPAGA